MKKAHYLTLLALSAVFTSTSKANDYCTEATLKQTRAVKENGCVLVSFHKTNRGECSVVYNNCTFKVFDPIKIAFVDHTARSLKGTFPNNQNIRDVSINTIYPSIHVNYFLGIGKPRS